MTLKDRVALVTGASRGIGAATAEVLAQRGAKVAVSGRTVADLERVAAGIASAGGKALAVPCDVLDQGQVEAMVKRVVSEWGRLDILVNNAALYYGIGRRPFYEVSSEEWDKLMAVNLKGPFLCAKAVFPQMKAQKKGKIINLSSETAFTGSKGFIHYVTSKGGIISLSRVLAAELGPHGICVNTIAPGFTDTEASRTVTDDISKYNVSLTPLGRLQQPQDLIGALLFLASDESDFFTGQALVVDGGRYMH